MELETREQLPAHSLDLLKDIETIFADPESWLQTPNTLLKGQKPIDLIGTPEEEKVRDMIEAFKYGLYS
jgi:uncharacterized protein (DUF2384 family)